MKDKEQFKASDYMKSLTEDELSRFNEERCLPQAFMYMYGLGEVSVTECKASDVPIVKPEGEFDLSYFMKIIPVELLDLDSFTVIRTDDEFTYDVNGEAITMNEFIIEVKKA